MSTEDPLIEFVRSINPIDARRAVHASQQVLRKMDVKFSQDMLPLILRSHPEALSPVQAMLHRTLLIDALRKLEAANAELVAMAEREYDQQMHLQTMAVLHPEYSSLQPYRLAQGAPAGGKQSKEG